MQENMINHNIIITEPSKNLRSLGRNVLNGKWKASVIAVCIYLLVINFPPIVFNAIFGTSIGSLFMNNESTFGMDAATFVQIYNSMPQYCFMSAVYIILITGAMELGITLFFLATFRRHEVSTLDVFLGFEKFKKALGLYMFRGLFTFLWSLLFLIPGIIASIRYSQAFFILADDPTKGIRQCMDESKTMMKGNKLKYFLLGLSFIGWLLLCTIPSALVESIGTVVSSSDFVIALFNLIGSLCMAPVLVYLLSTFAGFYEILAGHLIKETRPVPVTIEEAHQTFAEIAAEADSETQDDKGINEKSEDNTIEEKDNSVEDESTEKTISEDDGFEKDFEDELKSSLESIFDEAKSEDDEQ